MSTTNRPSAERLAEIRDCIPQRKQDSMYFNHVTELLAEIDALKSDQGQLLDDWMQNIKQVADQRDALRDQVRDLTETLEYYADETKWAKSTREPMKSLGWTPAELAKQTLAKYANEEDETKKK